MRISLGQTQQDELWANAHLWYPAYNVQCV